MSKKRKRDRPEVDYDLVEIYDQLAVEDSAKRIKAAHQLLTRVSTPGPTREGDIRSIVTRLFRGLSSGRKAARLGFAIALSEILTLVSASKSTSSSATIPPAQIVDILEDATSTEGNASGQDERDRYFGRLFGAEAIIQSGILLSSSDRYQWKRVLEIIFSVSQRKPWLRQECGWILYRFADSNSIQNKQAYVEDIIKIMNSRKLIRTPEGVAIWLAANKNYPEADLSIHVWKHKHPLAHKDISSLAEVMKNTRSGRLEDDQSQGSATWSPSLHFAWQVVLETLHNTPPHGSVSFADFWRVVVDEGLFSDGGSPERKSSGMLVWAMMLDAAPAQYLDSVFTRNALHCLVTTLHGQDGYLRKASQGVLYSLERRFKAPVQERPPGVLGKCVTALIKSTDFAKFDNLTKTNTLAVLLDTSDSAEQWDTWSALSDLLSQLDDDGQVRTSLRQRYIMELQSKILSACFKSEVSMPNSDDLHCTRRMINDWLSVLSMSKRFSLDTRGFLIDRIATAFEQALRYGHNGRALIKDTMSTPKSHVPESMRYPDFDNQISETVKEAVAELNILRKQEKEQDRAPLGLVSDAKIPVSLSEGMVLLYSAFLFDVFCGEADGAEMLQEFPSDKISGLTSGKLDTAEKSQLCDSLIEILLSLASRPSKLLRTVSTLVFESLAGQLSKEGIGALARVLVSKENALGQQEMFDAPIDDEDDVSEVSEDGSDELDSDVEMINGEDSSSASDQASTSEEDESSSEAGDELVAFDAALASALGTHKPSEENLDASSSSGSESDMSDSAMLALDEKLTEVFKARKEATSKKTERKNTKEAIVAFKNRVLDLVDVYLKQEYLNPLALELLLPLLQAIRTTQTKQLADRLCNVLREFCSRCKGPNVPILPSSSKSGSEQALSKLRAVHDEACLQTSNAHSAATSQVSILLVKVLVRAGTDVKAAVAIYADTRTRQLTDKACRLQPGFFTDWNNWCTTARNQLAK